MVSEPLLANRSMASTNSSGHTSSSVKQVEFASISKALNFNLSVKLTRDNYVYWRAQILPAIRALALEEFINGSRLCPAKYVVASSAEGVRESVINEDFEAWCRADQLLLCWLMSTISESLIGEVTDCLSSLEFWRVIETLFSRGSLAKVLQVKQQLQSVRKGSSSISEFILKVKGFGNSLRSAGQTVIDQDLILCVLNGLGHKYDSVVVMLSQQQLTMSLHEAQYMLMIHEQRIEHLNSFAQIDVLAPAANFVSQSGGRNGNRGGFASGNRGNTNNHGKRGRGGRWNNNRPPCQICGRSGHSAFQCYSRFDRSFQQQSFANTTNNGPSATGGGQAQQGNNYQGHMVQTQHNFSDSGGQFQTLQGNQPGFQGNFQNFQAYYGQHSTTPETVSDPTWYADSGATSHVTSDLGKLSNSSVCKSSSKLTVGSGQTLAISSIGQTFQESVASRHT
ncbi:hypothetical protein ACOSQ4_025676 [Xanthoceras sorbifolium]